jgi:hypothetical protein
MTEKRNQRELLWFQAGRALNFITAAPHCGETHGRSMEEMFSLLRIYDIFMV